MARFLQIKVQILLRYGAIAVQFSLGPGLSQGAGLRSKTSCAGIAVQFDLGWIMSQDAEMFLKATGAESRLKEQLSGYIYGRMLLAKTVTKK
jgi:hypothetical protein